MRRRIPTWSIVRPAILVLVASAAVSARAQAPAIGKSPLTGPIVHDDGRVTVGLKAPKADQVRIASGELQRLLGADAMQMTKGEDGVWSATIGPVAPGIYDFAFDVDGLRVVDPSSTHVMGNRTGARGYLEVPGPKDKPRIDQWRDVPHGTVTTHWYHSSATGTRRRVHVYVPPMPWEGYPPKDAETPPPRFPVVYLLHGSGDDDRHWTQLGQANVIADNLLAEKQCVPMIIVMPEGHPAGGPSNAPRDSAERRNYSTENRRLFERDLLADVLPLVEAHYPVRTDAAGRAIVGLSMGSSQAVDVGLKHADQFAWIGSFSGAPSLLEDAIAKLEADPKRANERIRLLWIGVGKEDSALKSNRDFTAKLKELGVKHEYRETDGAHTWSVWRRYLAGFLPRLFQ